MGLFDCFQRRFKTKRVSLHGGDKEATVKYLETFKQIIEDKIYKPEHVFNVDKTGFFWKYETRTPDLSHGKTERY